MTFKLTKKMKERLDFIESLPVSVRYPVHRKMALKHCLRFRQFMAEPGVIPTDVPDGMPKFLLKKTQIRMVKLRIWRSTGVRPSDS